MRLKHIGSQLAAMTALAILAAAVNPAAADEAKNTFTTKGEFVVCTDSTFPPLEFFEVAGAQQPTGFDIELAEALGNHWGIKSRIVVSEFTGLLPGLASQRCDAVISGVLVTPERTKTYDAVPYLDTTLVVFTGAKSDLAIESPADLSGKVVAVQAGTNYVGELEKVNVQLKEAGKTPITIQSYPKQTDVIQQVLVGRAAAAVSQDTELAYREFQKPGQLKSIYSFPGDDKFGVYLRPGGDKEVVSAAITALAKDGTLKSLAEKWHLSVDAVAKAD